jgi:hypothetical protein
MIPSTHQVLQMARIVHTNTLIPYPTHTLIHGKERGSLQSILILGTLQDRGSENSRITLTFHEGLLAQYGTLHRNTSYTSGTRQIDRIDTTH